MTANPTRLIEVYSGAAEKASPAEREQYLTAACQGEPELRRQVESLLQAREQVGSFLDQAVACRPAEVLAEGPGTRIGRYKLLEKIGEGGFGVVYMAEQQEPVQRRVALKIVKAGMDTREVIARFEIEQQALALMDHPNIAKVLDAGATETGRPYFVMELVHGIPITTFCDQRRLAPAERLRLFLKVCQAVQHAHQKAVIHRDLKPSNVLVTLHDGEPVPKVIDFGVAKALGRKLTGKTLFTGFVQMIGTPAYMSPEQTELSGLDIDTRADIYSLGVLLYELLTGVTPFDAKTLCQAALEDFRRLIRETEPPRPSTRLQTLGETCAEVARLRRTDPEVLGRLISGELDWIVMKCLEKDRARRYETAATLGQDIQRHLAHQPVSAAAPTLRYRLAKFAQRNRAALVIGTAFVLLLVVGTAVSTWQAVRANRARVLAERREAEGRENLWTSYLATARASRTSGRPGQRFAALEAAGKAAAIRPSFELRSEAASALALPDVRRVCEHSNLLPALAPVGGLIIDRRFERYAAGDEQGKVKILRVTDGRELLALPGAGTPQCFSSDGRLLATIRAAREAIQARIWNLDTGRLVLETPLSGNTRVIDFHPTAPVLGVVGPPVVVECFDLATGRRWSWPANNDAPSCLRFRPDGQQVAVSGPSGKIRVYETNSGTVLATLRHPNSVRYFDWSADGQWLAAPCNDGRVYLWDMSKGGTLDSRLEVHEHVVTSVGFDPRGEFLISQAWDGTSALWSLPSRSLLFKLPGCDGPLSFSADGQWLGPYVARLTVRLLEVTRAPACRVLPAQAGKAQCNGAFSPDGRCVVLGGEGLQCWDTRTGRRLWTEPAGYSGCVLFHPNGRVLLAFDETGPREWPWSIDAATGVPRLGELHRLPAGRTSQAEYNRDGSVLVMTQVEGLRVFDTNTPAPRLFPMPWCNFASVSPDGRWAAATPWADDHVLKVWDLASGQEVVCRTNDFPAMVAFTSNGRWLVLTRGDSYECLEVGTWQTVAHVPCEPGWAISMAVSPDSRWLAVEHGGRGRLHLFDLPTFRPFLTLDAASESPVCFSPDGTMLLTRRPGGQFALWDLRRVREELTPLGLGW